MRFNISTIKPVIEYFLQNGRQSTVNKFKIKFGTLTDYLTDGVKEGLLTRDDIWKTDNLFGRYKNLSNDQSIKITHSNTNEITTDQIKRYLKTGSYSVEQLADNFNTTPKNIRKLLVELEQNKTLIENNNDNYNILDTPREGGQHLLDEKMWKGDVLRFGFTSDNHLCSNFERTDILNLIYDICADEGISTVLNGGNWIEGEASFNKNEIHTRGLGKQIQYAVDNFPYREGIETWFVSGDDHEGWYNQREGVNIGEYFQMKREKAGKFDLKHLGYVEADINIAPEGEIPTWLRVMHAGGGSSYATSYAAQKIVESLQGGEKPSVLMIGHYHKLLYAYMRNVHTVQLGCTCDQSIFMRKKKIEAHVGGGIIELRRSKDGSINRCRVEFITAFDKKFYIGNDKYWKG
jgi:hypothetical protein